MALRGRLTLMSALIVGVVLLLASLVAYAAVHGQLRGQVDDDLRGNVAFFQRLAFRAGGGPPPPGDRTPPSSLGGPGGYAQLVRADGEAIELGPSGGPPIPVTNAAIAAARGRSDGGFSDVQVGGEHLRVMTASLGPEIGRTHV